MRPLRPLLLLLLCSLALPRPALAWEAHRAPQPDGQYRRWIDYPLQLRVKPPPLSIRATPPFNWLDAVRAAMSTWQAVPTAGVSFRFAGTTAPGPTAEPARGEVLVSFDAGDFPAGSEVTGVTVLTFDATVQHKIVSAHVHLNARDYAWATNGSPNALDVQTVALHELGHVLGLASPCGDPDTATPSCVGLPTTQAQLYLSAAMYPSISAGPRRQLNSDDIAGISTLAPVAVPEPSPQLVAVVPACATSLGGLSLSFDAAEQGGADSVQLSLDGRAVTQELLVPGAGGGLTAKLAVLAALPAGTPLPVQLDVLLIASKTGKAGELPAGLTIATSCKSKPAGGCSSSGAPVWLLLLPLLVFLRRSGRGCVPRAQAVSHSAIALVLLGALAAAPAQAYVRTTVNNAGGVCTFWASRGHSFQIDARGTPDIVGTAAFDAVRLSFAQWANITQSDLIFPDLGLSMNPADRKVGYFPGQYNRNLVLWRTALCQGGAVPAGDPCIAQGGCGNKYDCWEHDPQVIATTTTTSNRFTGEIEDSDIELNDSPSPEGKFTFTTVDSPPCVGIQTRDCVSTDIRNTVTHEAGHSLGLAHSLDPAATMYAYANPGDIDKRTLHADDIQAIADIYPKGGRTVTCLSDPITLTVTGSADVKGCGCSATGGAGPALEGAALVLCAFLLRGRSRSRHGPRPRELLN